MPTYQYACTACGHEFELFQAFSEDAISICPLCQGEVRKVYSNVGVVFKGSGFYKNDSRTSTTSTEKKSPTPAPTSAPKSDPAP